MIIQEERQIFSELFADALEDTALAKAIEEGRDTEPVSREAIFKILDGLSGELNSGKALRKI